MNQLEIREKDRNKPQFINKDPLVQEGLTSSPDTDTSLAPVLPQRSNRCLWPFCWGNFTLETMFFDHHIWLCPVNLTIKSGQFPINQHLDRLKMGSSCTATKPSCSAPPTLLLRIKKPSGQLGTTSVHVLGPLLAGIRYPMSHLRLRFSCKRDTKHHIYKNLLSQCFTATFRFPNVVLEKPQKVDQQLKSPGLPAGCMEPSQLGRGVDIVDFWAMLQPDFANGLMRSKQWIF